MKILEMITFLASGGAERFVVDLSNELAKSNDVCLMTILDDKKDVENRNFYRFAVSDNVKYVNLGLPNGLKCSSQMAVERSIEKVNPDVIHIHLACTLNYSALAVFTLAWKYKIYMTIHNDIHNGYDSGLVKLMCNTYGRWKRFKVVCLSEKNYHDFVECYPKAEGRCIVNGRAPIVPTEMFDKVKLEMMGFRGSVSSRLFIHIARFNAQKNQNLLVEAFNELIDEGKDIDLVVIGNGFDSAEGMMLRDKACKRIHFIGTRKNISDYVLNADIFCLSSDFEGMPISLLEASLAGLPAVSTPVCGAVDLIENGINGYLSIGHSLNEYKMALTKAIDNYAFLKSNTMKMKEKSPYTIEICSKKYMEYFSE